MSDSTSGAAAPTPAQSLALYERMLIDGNTRSFPSAHLYGTTTVHQTTGDARRGNSFLLTLAFKNLGR